jgi:hypothetical protein
VNKCKNYKNYLWYQESIEQEYVYGEREREKKRERERCKIV